MTRVLVVAESAMERAGLEALVARDAAMTVVGHAARGPGNGRGTLVQQVEELDPDVVIIAIAGGEDEAGETPPDALARVVAGTRAVLLVLTDAGDSWVSEALRAGVRAVLPRDASGEVVTAGIAAVAAGLVVVDPRMTAAVSGATVPPPARETSLGGDELTPREAEVLRMLAEGLGNKQVAARLGISEHTVKFHVASIFTKLHASTRTEAVMLGARRGLIVV